MRRRVRSERDDERADDGSVQGTRDAGRGAPQQSLDLGALARLPTRSPAASNGGGSACVTRGSSCIHRAGTCCGSTRGTCGRTCALKEEIKPPRRRRCQTTNIYFSRCLAFFWRLLALWRFSSPLHHLSKWIFTV